MPSCGALPNAKLRTPRARVPLDLLGVSGQGPAGHDASKWAAAGAHWLTRWAATSAPIAERALDDTILTRVVRDHGEAAIREQAIAESRQRPLQRVSLVIHRHSNRLKQRCEIRWPGSGAQRRSDGIDQIVAGRERLPRATVSDRPREPCRSGFVREIAKHRGQLDFAR